MYTIEWSEEATKEMRVVRSFVRPLIRSAVEELAHQAETETMHRKRLDRTRGLPPEYPDPTWQIRIEPYRVLYTVEQQTVTILGVKLKGRRVTGEIL